MNTRENVDRLKKRLAQLEILEKKEKERLEKRLAQLKILEKKEKERLEKEGKLFKILKKEKEIHKNQRKKHPQKKSRGKYIKNSIAALATLGIVIGGGSKLWEGKNTEEEKTINIPENNNIPEKTTSIPENNDIPKNTISWEKAKEEYQQQETKKQKTQKRTTKNITETSASHIHKDFIQDEVFVVIEQHNPNIDSDRYKNRELLSSNEKIIVQNIYYHVIASKNEQEIRTILSQIDNIKITRGLRDVLVKKSYMLEKQKKNIRHLQLIGRINIERESDIIMHMIQKTENIVDTYTIEPNAFSIATIKNTESAKNLDDNKGTIQIYFILQAYGNALAKISFDTDGNLLTKTITANNIHYTLTQQGTTIQIQEQLLSNN